MNIFNLSFGKDSMATLILAAEQGIPIDRVMYCEIKFNDEISGEHPIMAEWIPTAEKRLKELFGITVDHAYSGVGFEGQFYKRLTRGKFKGFNYGFPHVLSPWCNTLLKIRAINRYMRNFDDTTTFIGIAYDEPVRWERMLKKQTEKRKYRSLLVEQKLAEQDAFEICKRYDLLSPMYNVDGIYRGGCWFCPKQCLADLYSLWKTYPDLWQKLCDMEPDSHNTFKPNETMAHLTARFEGGYVPIRRKQRATEKQISIDEYLEGLNEKKSVDKIKLQVVY